MPGLDKPVGFPDDWSHQQIKNHIDTVVLPKLRSRAPNAPSVGEEAEARLRALGLSGEEVKRRAAAGEAAVQEGLRNASHPHQAAAVMATNLGEGVVRGTATLASLVADVAHASGPGGMLRVVADGATPNTDATTRLIAEGGEKARAFVGLKDVQIGPVGEIADFVGEIVAPGPEVVGALRRGKPALGLAEGAMRHAAGTAAEAHSAALLKYYDGALTPAQEARLVAGEAFELTEAQKAVALDNVRGKKAEIIAREAEFKALADKAGEAQAVASRGPRNWQEQFLVNAEAELRAKAAGLSEELTPPARPDVAAPQRATIDAREFRHNMQAAGIELTSEQAAQLRKGLRPQFDANQLEQIRYARWKRGYEASIDGLEQSDLALAPIGDEGMVRAVVDSAARPVNRVLERGGGTLAKARDGLWRAHAEHSQAMGRVKPFLSQMAALSEAEQELLMKTLDGQTRLEAVRRVQPAVARLAVVMRKLLDDVADKATAAKVTGEGVDGNVYLFRPMENYAPHLKRSGEAKASALSDELGFRQPGAAAGSMNARTGGELITRADELTNYFDRAYREIAEKKHFGAFTKDGDLLAQNEQIARGIQLLKESAMRNGHTAHEVEFMEKALKHVLGGGDKELVGTAKALGKLTTLSSLVHLPYSAINNFAQIANTFKQFDVSTIVRAAKSFATDPYAREAALRSGGPVQTVIRDLMGPAEGKLERAVTWMLNHNGFTAAEKMNRTVTTLSAMMWADRTAEAALGRGSRGVSADSAAEAAKALEQLGVDMATVRRYGGLTRKMREDIGFYFSEKLQHGTRPEDLPLLWVNNPLAKVGTLFMGYPLKQFYFVMDELFKPLTNARRVKDVARRVASVGRYLAAGIPLYLLADAANDLIRLRNPNDRPPQEKFLRIMTSLAGTGILTETIKSFFGRGNTSVVVDDAIAIGRTLAHIATHAPADIVSDVQDGTSPINDLVAKTPIGASLQNLTQAGQWREEEIRETSADHREAAVELKDEILSRVLPAGSWWQRGEMPRNPGHQKEAPMH